MTNSENTIRTFATLRFAGDALDPDEISRVVKEKPTRAYEKGQMYRPGPRSPEITGKTGVWCFSRKHNIQSNDLADHLNALERLISPFADQDSRLKELREIMERGNLEAHVDALLAWSLGSPTPHRSIRRDCGAVSAAGRYRAGFRERRLLIRARSLRQIRRADKSHS
jgi:Domain of unknown function (DUF4279)